MCNHMAWSIDLDCVIADQTMGLVERFLPAGAIGCAGPSSPANEAEAVVPPYEEVVCDIKIRGTRIFGPDAKADVFKSGNS